MRFKPKMVKRVSREKGKEGRTDGAREEGKTQLGG